MQYVEHTVPQLRRCTGDCYHLKQFMVYIFVYYEPQVHGLQ